jgi:uncharacterized RDD family membrane protein YckC
MVANPNRNVKVPPKRLPGRWIGPRRLIAGCIDFGLLYILAQYSMGQLRLSPLFLQLTDGWPQWLPWLVVIGYFYLFLTIMPHVVFAQTLGKFLMNIKVFTLDYQRLSLALSLKRDIAYKLTSLLHPASLLNQKGKAHHDLAAKTMVMEAL